MACSHRRGTPSFLGTNPAEVREGHYNRVQGSTFLLEFDKTQSGASHIQSVWRDSAGDFGPDPLREHYERSHQGP